MINAELINTQIPNQPPELYCGNKEYKEQLRESKN